MQSRARIAAADGGVSRAQVAAQELAWGIKFSATATLDIEELPNGIAAAQREGSVRMRCVRMHASALPGLMRRRCRLRKFVGARMVIPRSPGPPPQSVRDICFTLVDSRDLKYFSGTWRIESREGSQARLIYAVEVQPQPWLPVCACPRAWCTLRVCARAERLTRGPAALIASRVGKDMRANLAAVRDHAEELGQSAVALPAPPSPPRLLRSGA